MEEIRVATWTDLQEQLFADSWHPELRRFRSDFAYRGRNDFTRWLARYYVPRGP